jgi:hypothetical protein
MLEPDLPIPDQRTHITLRDRGTPAGLSRVAPLMAPGIQRANRKELSKLKAILEQP